LLPDSLKGSLIPVLTDLQFNEARQFAEANPKLLPHLLQALIDRQDKDTFDWIQQNHSPQNHSIIESVVSGNVDRLASIDVTKFIELLKTHFRPVFLTVLARSTDPAIRNDLVFNLLLADHFAPFRGHVETVAEFVCDYYPEKMLPIFQRYGDAKMGSLLPLFQSKNMVACAALLCFRAGNVDGTIKNLRQVILRRTDLQLVPEITEQLFAMPGLKIDKLFHQLAKCYLLPLSKTKGDIDDICTSLKGLMSSAMTAISYDQALDYYRRIFAALGPERYDNVVHGLLTDFVFDQDRTTKIAVAIKAKGGNPDMAKCGNCQMALFAPGVGIAILPCGHAFHAVSTCTGFASCPICPPKK
jgi:hypothetical protein